MTLIISCVGDSLTAGEMRYSGQPVPMSYQYWMEQYLNENDIEVNIVNYGMPGALMNSITRQVPMSLPTDWIIIMGGTNDFWIFSNPSDDEQNKECITDVLNEIELAIDQAIKGDINKIVICSIPPVGVDGYSLEQTHKNILSANEKIRVVVIEKGLIFCDVHSAMSDLSNNNHMESGLCQNDGVHFTREGNKRCGIEIGKTILEKLDEI